MSNYKITKPIFFEARKSNKRVYLFGTMHLGVEADDLPQWFWKYFDNVDTYAFESQSELSDRSKLRSWLEEKSTRKPGTKPLKELLTEQEYSNLDRYFPNIKDKDKYFSKKSAFWVLQAIGNEQFKRSEAPKEGHAAQKTNSRAHWGEGLDEALIKKAALQNKKIISLDEASNEFLSCEFQTDENRSLKAIKYYLSQQKTSQPSMKESVRNMVDDYRSGKFQKNISQKNPNSPLNLECLISGRNILWLPKLLKLSEESSSVFVGVGVAHIRDDEPTLITLLEQHGFQVRRLEE